MFKKSLEMFAAFAYTRTSIMYNYSKIGYCRDFPRYGSTYIFCEYCTRHFLYINYINFGPWIQTYGRSINNAKLAFITRPTIPIFVLNDLWINKWNGPSDWCQYFTSVPNFGPRLPLSLIFLICILFTVTEKASYLRGISQNQSTYIFSVIGKRSHWPEYEDWLLWTCP